MKRTLVFGLMAIVIVALSPAFMPVSTAMVEDTEVEAVILVELVMQ